MESYNGSEHVTGETYLIPGTESNSHFATTPSLEQIEVMGNEGHPEFIVDQGLYYPATNYYGYYCTGFESTREWDDHHRFFGLDGPDLHYAGLQTENMPYVYYTPTYGYAQSPYNPYNPYIPGAVVGVDGSFVGMQQYYTGFTYQHPASSPAYFPLVVQSRPDNIPNSALEPHLLNSSASNANGPDVPGLKPNPPSAFAGMIKVPPRPASGDVRVEPADSVFNQSYSSLANAAPSKQPVAHTSLTSGSVPHSASLQVSQGRTAVGSNQGADQLSVGRVSSLRSPLKVASSVTNVLPDFGSNARGWAVVDKLRPKLHYGGVSNNGNGSQDLLGEQNRGPRMNRSKSQWTPSIPVDAYTAKTGTTIEQGKIIIYADQYNMEDFPVNYANAKFFVIKSYSEDDVHKSIKYNVWSSTPNGNKRLDIAYQDAQTIAAGKPRGCPVFLFFSVNASGQFCGVAEMIGAVDFNKDMDFWQQDKWSGSFPVKWHMIKDVPNTNFRHIILENNENKPVTNSRDTQEIKCKQGMEMLNIFKNYTLKTSLLDDFMYYEERQKIMHEEKYRLLGKSYDSSFFIPAIIPLKKTNGLVDQHPSADEKGTTHNDQNSYGKKPNALVDLHISADEKPTTHNDQNCSGKMVDSTGGQVLSKPDAINSASNGKDNIKSDVVGDANDGTSVLKIGTLTIDPKQGEAKHSAAAATVASTEAVDVVTVGSMSVKVNGFAEASSGILTVGTIPIVPKAFKFDKPSPGTSTRGGGT